MCLSKDIQEGWNTINQEWRANFATTAGVSPRTPYSVLWGKILGTLFFLLYFFEALLLLPLVTLTEKQAHPFICIAPSYGFLVTPICDEKSQIKTECWEAGEKRDTLNSRECSKASEMHCGTVAMDTGTDRWQKVVKINFTYHTMFLKRVMILYHIING